MTMTEEPSALDLKTKSEALEKSMADTQRELADLLSTETYAAADLERTKKQFNEYVTQAKALEAEPEIGLLLPCNVVLREAEEGVEVLIQDPKEMFRVLPEATQRALAPVAEEARTRLSRALARL